MERCSSFLSALLFSEVNDKMAIDSENEKQTGAAWVIWGVMFILSLRLFNALKLRCQKSQKKDKKDLSF